MRTILIMLATCLLLSPAYASGFSFKWSGLVPSPSGKLDKPINITSNNATEIRKLELNSQIIIEERKKGNVMEVILLPKV